MQRWRLAVSLGRHWTQPGSAWHLGCLGLPLVGELITGHCERLALRLTTWKDLWDRLSFLGL
jgi:hypothetical protein